jgi:hypothetical protein
MATVFEPPPLLAVLVVLAATALAYAAGIRRRLPGGLAGAAGAAESELDERWGSEAPPPPAKRPYAPPAPTLAAPFGLGAGQAADAARAELEPTGAPGAPAPARAAPPYAPPAPIALRPEAGEAPEEISFADLFARGRRTAPAAAPDLPDREVASSK